MSFLKLTIHGDFWDSYLYGGQLYLFKSDGDISIVSWKKLISGIEENNLVSISRYLNTIRPHDNPNYIYPILPRGSLNVEISPMLLNKSLKEELENPFTVIPTDIGFYKNHFFLLPNHFFLFHYLFY